MITNTITPALSTDTAATLLARFRFALVPGKTPKPVMILTLRPQGGVWLGVQRV